jgi:bifunctional N-acetylglucosamine-1-phosphate-uridyltransferase/glucosamine-1-phosphate-acetyltransferase GlmU-like protein
MLSTIKICFELYYSNLKPVIKSDKVYDIEKMDIKDIEAEVDILHMMYITKSIFSVSKTSVQFEAYVHMTNLIQKYYETYECEVCSSKLVNKEGVNKEQENEETNKVVESVQENNVRENNIQIQDPTKKGWFFK